MRQTNAGIRKILLCPSFFLLGISVFQHNPQGVVAATSSSDEEHQCGLYMALSSTANTEGKQWGLYAGKDIEINDVIGYPELAINMPHFEANNLQSGQITAELEIRERILEYVASFMWVPEPAGARFEMEEGTSVTAIPGTGVLGCFHPRFKNAKWNHQAAYAGTVPSSLGEETPIGSVNVAHPGRGAYTPFSNVILQASDTIKKGTEVFVDFGSNWEEEEEKDAISKEEFEKMDETVVKMVEYYQKHTELSEEEKLRIYKFLLDDILAAAVGKAKAEKFRNLLPKHPDELPTVVEMGGTKVFSEPEIYRSISWLEEHGRCVDNLRPGKSTIPDAGMGAFATRELPKGTIIAPIPLIHVPDKTVFDLHELTKLPNGDFIAANTKAIGTQLAMNYCFAHPESSMVFLPAGVATSFINHSDEPNARLVWSDHPASSRSWFQQEPISLVADDKMEIGLVLEVVALRDIAKDEEVTIDYGDEWKKAWTDYSSKWKKLQDGRVIPKVWPTRAADLNQEFRSRPFKIEDDLAEEPYPSNVALKAFLTVHPDKGTGTESNPKVWDPAPEGRTFDANNLFDIVVLSYEESDDPDSPFLYTIRWLNPDNEPTIVEDVPHEAIVFVDSPGTSDQYAEFLFRHPIGIPDDIFPQGPWRNLQKLND